MKKGISDLIAVSRKYGSDPDWILAGGGNTSMKEDGVLYVKASGFQLSTIEENGFVRMSMRKLGDIWLNRYSDEEKKREAEVLEDMMAARIEGETARPSVEALLHSLIDGRLVVHTHPTLINGLTCARMGEDTLTKLFGDKALWIPLTRPGYILASNIKTRLDAAAAAGKPYPEMIFLQNHGLFVAGETPEDIDRLHLKAAEGIRNLLDRKPVKTTEAVKEPRFSTAAEAAWGRKLETRSAVNKDILGFAESDDAFGPLRLPFNPDQIVYSGPGPIRIDSIDELPAAVEQYKAEWIREPQAVLIKGVGLFTVGDTGSKAESALALTLDAARIAVYAESFGGARPMTKELIIFIRDWEVEQYRAKVSK